MVFFFAILSFSANARSLFFAILGEFNAARYPSELILRNGSLQQLSGIRASSSFDAARNALINAGAIKHKREVYRLGEFAGKPVEESWKNRGKPQGLLSVTQEKKKEREREREVKKNGWEEREPEWISGGEI